jgi:hypothetical protein
MFFKRLDVLPRRLSHPVEQQWNLFTICDSSHGRFETRSRPALARRYPRDFTFYLGNPFPRLFVCHYIAKNSLLQFLLRVISEGRGGVGLIGIREWSEWDERHGR